MIDALKGWFASPTFDDEVLTRRAAVLHASVLLSLLVPLFVGSALWGGGARTTGRAFAAIAMTAASVPLWFALRRGHVAPVGWTLVAGWWLALAAVAFSSGFGIRAGVVPSFSLVVLIAGLAIGPRAALAVAGATILATGILVPLTPLPHPAMGPTNFWAWLSQALVVSAITVFVATQRADVQRLHRAYGLLDSRWRRIVDQMRGMVAVLKPDGTIVDMNATAHETTGVDLGDWVGRHVWDGPWWRDLPEVAADMRREIEAAAAGSIRRVDSSFLDGLGNRHVVDCGIHPFAGEDGTISHVIVECLDVTEERRAQAQLRETEEFYRTILDDAVLGVAIVNADLEYTYVNDALTDILGYEREELLGRPVLSLVHPDDVLQGQALSGDRPKPVRTRMRHKDGQWRTVETVSRDFRQDSTLRGIVSIGRDVTDEATAQAKLQEREKFFRTLVQSDFSVVRVGNRSGRILYSSSPETLLGYTSDEFEAARAQDDFGLIHPDDVDELIAGYREAVRVGRARRLYRIRHKEGHWVDLEMTAVDCSDDPAIGGVVSHHHDLTELRKQQRTSESLAAELRRAEAMSAMGALVAGVAHEVRNPLFGITATIDALEDQLSGRDLRRAFGEHFDVLRTEVERLRTLMQDLLDYGRPTATELVPGEVGPVLERAARDCRAYAEAAGVVISLPENAPVVRAALDSARLQLAVHNLLENAVQHSDSGAVVSVDLRERVDGKTHWVDCTVEDTGPGVPEDILPHLFEPFVSKRVGGTGLGLAIVERIVADHQGAVDATNRSGGGAALTLSLPVLADQ